MHKSPMFRLGLLFTPKAREMSKDHFDRPAQEQFGYNTAYNETSRTHGGKYVRSLTGYQKP